MPEQKEVTPKPIPKKINYGYAGKESLSESIGKSFPKQLIPTKRMGPILGWIFFIVVVIALIQFPYGQMLSGNINIIISIGYPWHFFEFDLSNGGGSPLLLANLFLDIILYVIVAYLIDVALNLVLENPLLKSEEQKQQQPVVFKDKNPTVAEKITKKVFEKVAG
ncbi:MAG: hypothetical protein ABIF18_04355 [archaeon]